MKDLIQKTGWKLETAADLKVTEKNSEALTCTGTVDGNFVELYVSISRPSLTELCQVKVPEKNSIYVSAKVNSAQAFAGDIYDTDMETVKDVVYLLSKKVKIRQNLREEAYEFLIS